MLKTFVVTMDCITLLETNYLLQNVSYVSNKA